MSGTIDLPGSPLTRVSDDAQEQAATAGHDTLAARLRSMGNAVTQNAVEDFPVPGWIDDLGRPTLKARMRVIDDVEEFAALAQAGDPAFLVAATRVLLLRNDAGTFDELVVNETPVGFGTKFAEMMGWTHLDSASGVVLEAVGPHEPGKTNPLAVGDWSLEVITWMRGKRNVDGLRPT